MNEKSKKINLYNPDIMEEINQDTLSLFRKYQRDMSIRGL